MEDRLRPVDSKSTRSPKVKSSSLKHKTRSPAEAVRQSEQSLRQLLEDFEGGRLNAFGNSDMLQQMNNIREMQDQLTLKHFEIDRMRRSQENTAPSAAGGAGPTSGGGGQTGGESDDASLMELTRALERLGSAIQSLHSTDSLTRPESRGKPTKKVQVRTDLEALV